MTSRIFFVLSLFTIFMLTGANAGAANGYCASKGTVSSYEWINSVSINGQSFGSGNNGGYIEHVNQTAALQAGSNVVTLTPGFAYSSYVENWRGWLDINGDDVFSEEELIFEYSGTTAHNATFDLPASIGSGTTTLRVVMQYGGLPAPCGNYYYGETEDFTVAVDSSGVVPEYAYHLTLDHDFTVHRDGALGDDVSWVIEKNGQIVLQRNAAGELEYRYYSNTAGSDFRIWLQQFINGSYQQVSNVVEYTPGITDLYQLNLMSNYELQRSGMLGDNVQWVIEKDGAVVLQRNASNELSYTYFNNVDGSSYRVWLQQFINGQYLVVSNTVSYDVGQVLFTLTVNGQFELTRNGQLGDEVQWVIERDGVVVLERYAANELTYTYFNNNPGSSYRVWLKMFVNGQYEVVSNIVEYQVPAAYPYTLTLGPNYQINRSGSLGDNVQWVIVKNGSVVLQRLASNELSYTYYSNTPGSTIQVYLQQFIGGYYQPVSNTVTYTP